MKKKTIGVICILLIVLASISFIGYKVYLLNAYSTKEFDNNYLYFLDILKKKDTYTIKSNNKQISDYIKYDKLKIGNMFKNYVLQEQIHSNLIEYHLYENNKTTASVVILETNPIYKSEIYKDEEKISIDNILKRHNLNNTLDLFEYLSKNKNNNLNIFSSKEDIKESYAIKKALSDAYGNIEDKNNKLKGITFIDGKYKGYLITYPFNYEITILNSNKNYVISLINTNLSKQEVYDLLNTINIEK